MKNKCFSVYFDYCREAEMFFSKIRGMEDNSRLSGIWEEQQAL